MKIQVQHTISFLMFFLMCTYSPSQEIDSVPGAAEIHRNKLSFEIIKIPTGKFEAVAFGDFNNDKIQDIVAGDSWHEGPLFTRKHTFRTMVDRGFQVSPEDMMGIIDVDKDGYDEVIAGGHDMGLFMYKNPGKSGGQWTRIGIDDRTLTSGPFPHDKAWHSGGLVDVDGDGKKEELLSTGVRIDNIRAAPTMRWYKYVNGRWQRFDTGVQCFQWGSGIGDINGDGKNDIICPDAWLEKTALSWVRHEFNSSILADVARTKEPEPTYTNSSGHVFGHSTQIYTYDVNDDGLNDILTAAAHGFGVYWYEQRMIGGKRVFIEHPIDLTWSSAHSLEFEDMDNDGDPDLVTGKRWGIPGFQPDGNGANGLYWYELTPGASNPWTRHTLSFDRGIGQGNKGDIKDYDGDGDLDILANSQETNFVYLFKNKLDPVDTVLTSSIKTDKTKNFRLSKTDKTLSLFLEQEAHVRVAEYNVSGKWVQNIMNTELSAGISHKVPVKKGFVYQVFLNGKLVPIKKGFVYQVFLGK